MDPLHQKSPEASSESPKKAAENAGFKGLLAAQIESEKKIFDKNHEASGDGVECEKRLEVVSDKGVVKFIRLHCSCGEVTEIACDYGE